LSADADPASASRCLWCKTVLIRKRPSGGGFYVGVPLLRRQVFWTARACGVRGRAVASFKTNRLKTSMCEVIKTACGGRPNCTVRIYGQMVDVLWKNGQQEAAIRLETLWNQLANTQAFSLLCGYAMGQFYTDANFQEGLSPPHTCCSGRWGNVCCGSNHARTPAVGCASSVLIAHTNKCATVACCDSVPHRGLSRCSSQIGLCVSKVPSLKSKLSPRRLHAAACAAAAGLLRSGAPARGSSRPARQWSAKSPTHRAL
jgi:hypothetical protein